MISPGARLMYKKERAENLKNNLRYLITSRGETQLSLCNSSGLTRTTIYNILEGRVVNVQQATIRKISDFFGVSYKEIETVDLAAKEIVESDISLHGNMNPAAVPIIKESLIVQSLERRIGELVATHPLTYYFGMSNNLIGILLEHEIGSVNEPGDLLIVKRGSSSIDSEKLMYDNASRRLSITDDPYVERDALILIGDIMEERFSE